MELTGEGHWKRSRNMKDELMYWNKNQKKAFVNASKEKQEL